MTVCLYKCLTAAGLQRHYARFTLMGVYRAAHLSTLRMEDYPILGVCSMEDRARLFQLVQLVKSLDLRSLTHDDIGINESECEGSDEIFPANNNSFSPDGYRDKDESGTLTGISNASHYRPSYACRRLDFSAEITDQRMCSHFEDTIHVEASHSRNDDPVHENGSGTPIQLGLHSRSTALCDLQQCKNSKLNERSCSCDPHNGESIKLHITRGSSVFNSHIRLVPMSETFNKLNPSPAAVTLETFTNKPSAQKDRRAISRSKNCSIDVTKPIPVYEAKRTAGYNYGLPLSSPQATNRHVEGQRISVCVRKRPLTRPECRRGEADVVTTPGGECVVVHESKEAVDLTEYILQHRFHFDKVFGEKSSNEEVYQKTAYPLVQHMLSGGKATCFAYGQTGAGKTYTMLGSPRGGKGLYALAVQDIFAHLSATRTSIQVYVSFFEIYCGQLYDLLEHRKRLFAREDGKKVVHISGLRDVRVDSVSSLLEVISQGTAERTQGMSGVNPLSSRSHALLQIQLRDLNQKIAGRMWFVDLAGSERASDTKEPNKQSRMEGAEINQSLLALKECIRSLDKEESHTPFRQSKLTQVLKDSFVGDSMTCMIANISPGHSATEHTQYSEICRSELRGQNGLIGRRSNKVHSDKMYMSGSNKRNRRNVGTKNPKIGNQNESFCPKTQSRPHIWDTVFYSTPKKTTCGEETQSRNRNHIQLEHVSPIRSLSQSEVRCLNEGSEVRRDWITENERSNDIHTPCVKGKHTRAVVMLGQQNKGAVKGGELTFSEREFGFYPRVKENHQQTMKGRRREDPEWTEMRRQVKSCRDTCGEEEGLKERELHNADSKEKVRHLRQYHQQLQQFLPSPTSSFVHPLSSSTRPSLSLSTQGSLSSLLSSQAATNSFLQGDNGNTSINPFKIKSEKDERRETENRCSFYVEKVKDLVEDEYAEFFLSHLELPQSKIHQINVSAASDAVTATVHHEQQKYITSTVGGRGANKPVSIQVHDNNMKKQSTLEKNLTVPKIEPLASSFIQSTDHSGCHSSHKTLEYAEIMHSKSLPNINKQNSNPQSGCLNSALPNYYNSSRAAAEPFNPAELGGEESSNQHIKPTVHLLTMDRLDHARLSIIEAHLEQLKEMEAICHKEGKLLCQQHDMAFVEFVHKLAEILERKGRCVHSMRAQLRPYLKTNHQSTQEDYENAII